MGAKAAVLYHVQVVPVHVVEVALVVEAVVPVAVLEDALEGALVVAIVVVRAAAVHVLVTVAALAPEDAQVVAHLDVPDVPDVPVGARIPANTVANGAPLN